MEPEGIIEPLDAVVDGNRSASEGLKSRANGVATSTSLVDALTTATKEFSDCWAAPEATGVKLCNAFRKVCNRRAAREEICVDAKKALQRTFEVKRKATEIQEDVAAHRERTRRITNEHARAEGHVNDGIGSTSLSLSVVLICRYGSPERKFERECVCFSNEGKSLEGRHFPLMSLVLAIRL